MGGKAVAAVSEALRGIIASPADMSDDRHTRVGSFLCHVDRHVLYRPRAMHDRGPRGFSLAHLIAPEVPEPLRCQEIPARVLCMLCDPARIQVPEAGDELEVALEQHSVGEKMQLWSALDAPYPCALYYDGRMVRLTNEPLQ